MVIRKGVPVDDDDETSAEDFYEPTAGPIRGQILKMYHQDASNILSTVEKGETRGQLAMNKIRNEDRHYHNNTVSHLDPPIDPSNWFDIILSCGLGAKRYSLGSGFVEPKFRVSFAKKIFLVLLVQLTIYLILMSLILTSNFFIEGLQERKEVIIASCIIYLILYLAVRFTRCGGDGICIIGYLFILMVMIWCLVLATTTLGKLFPCWIFVVAANWLTLVIITSLNCCKPTNILGKLIYAIAFCGGLVNGAIMILVIIGMNMNPKSLDEMTKQFILPLILIPAFLSMLLVHEVKKLIGGRRTSLDDEHWMIAAIVL